MSLLLDALKKAADDKNKTTKKTAQENTIDENNIRPNTDLDEQLEDSSTDLNLELEMDSGLTHSNQSSESSEEFPEVDNQVIAEKKVFIKSKASLEKPLTTDKEFLSSTKKDSVNEKTDDKQTKGDIENTSTDEQSSDIDEKNEPPLELIDETNDSETEHNNKNTATDVNKEPQNYAHKKPSQTATHATAKIENEQALSELINKSNLYSKREKLKKNISIGILIGLLLFGSGLYFYIKMQTSNQELYITQNNNADIQRNSSPTQVKNLPAPITQQPVNTLSSEIKASPKKPQVTPSKPKATIRSITTKPTATKPITFTRTKKIDPIHLLIRKAYDAFHKQDYRESEILYKKALTREPKNRDALLGLAAIGTKEKRYEYTRQKYLYLLKLDPRDSFAIAGLSSIENRIDPQLNESQLKFLIKQQPEAAHLYFALGSQYTIQKKWAEAQTAFFSAWSAEDTNADYAYNLAVSLDHLDKHKTALKFYQLSLKLKQASSGNFSKIDTEKRIQTLQENVK